MADRDRLNSDDVYGFIGRKVRTTREIATQFSAKPQQAAAAIAILRIRGVVEPAVPPKDENNVSRWRRRV